MSFLSIIFGYLCIPDLKGRSLEEAELIFESGVPLRKFGDHQLDVGAIDVILAAAAQKDDTDVKIAELS